MLSSSEVGLMPKPAQAPFVDRTREHPAVLQFAYQTAKALGARDGVQANSKTLLNAFVNVNRTSHLQYEFVFANLTHQLYTRHILQVTRPFRPLEIVEDATTIVTDQTVHIVMPLSGRADKLDHFLSMLGACVRAGKRVFLTIVYFGEDGAEDAEKMLAAAGEHLNFNDYRFMRLELPFSRGRGLQEGAMSWTQTEDVLLFFADVDIHFDAGFLDRCQVLAEKGKSVYYPIVFSQYNPTMVYRNMTQPPPLNERFVVDRGAGYWRDFGFGMACQYLSDFKKVGGFDLKIKGWGGEDVNLYQSFLRNKSLRVVRALDRFLFHVFHTKECDPKLTREQAEMCFGSKGVSEASHRQMGHLVFKR